MLKLERDFLNLPGIGNNMIETKESFQMVRREKLRDLTL
jgi:hypothetical protein